MKATAPPAFPDGSMVAEKELMAVMAKVDSHRIDYPTDGFIRYKNGGIKARLQTFLLRKLQQDDLMQ